MSRLAKAAMMGAAGAAGDKLYVEDVFSTYLYTGNGSTQTITNGIDLAGEGGLVWIKGRSVAYGNYLFDTERGTNKELISNNTNAQSTVTDGLNSFNSDGFTLGSRAQVNQSPDTYASWTFRKAEKFFDVVTYTGNGTNQTISHNLGSTPGCIMFKNLDTADHWVVYHRGISVPANKALVLNADWAEDDDVYFNDTAPTSTQFSVGAKNQTNGSGNTIVAYLFAHDAGGFGDDETESVIKCGSFTSDGSGFFDVNLGWEPQWILIKASSTTGDWFLLDTMRGLSRTNIRTLRANTTGTDINYAAEGYCFPYASGFASTNNFFGANTTFVYIAIRRGPMKTPTDATEVFSAVQRAGTSAAATITSPGFPVDLVVNKGNGSGTDNLWFDRLRGVTKYVLSNSSNNEGTNANSLTSFASNVGYSWGNDDGNFNTQTYIDWVFRRAPGFFDMVTYTGTGSARTISHNLGVTPEFIITRGRVNGTGMSAYHSALGPTKGIRINDNELPIESIAFWNNTSPTESVFSVRSQSDTNVSGYTYIAYLFATIPNVSKVGSYTGTGTTLNIDCGFTAGARFVLIRRTDTRIDGQTYDTDWYVWDSTRGIVSGNDPYLVLNTSAAEVTNTDFIDPLSSGFQITSSAPAAINALNGEYIFLAIA